MLVHPEVGAWLNRQSRSELEEKKPRPLVVRGEKIGKGGAEKTRAAQKYDPEAGERGEEVEYLNERQTSLNLYA
ncbi:MAG: hypothetical protein LBP33_13650 [Candidatus Adiutrix sp.]|nr:hypothetical protein [Candidatus Adiutrix sp.]